MHNEQCAAARASSNLILNARLASDGSAEVLSRDLPSGIIGLSIDIIGFIQIIWQHKKDA